MGLSRLGPRAACARLRGNLAGDTPEKESAAALKSNRKYRRLGLGQDGLVERPTELVRANVATLKRRLKRYGLADRLALCSWGGEVPSDELREGCLDLEAAAEADLLLNLRYDLPGGVVERFRRSALLDIDPGCCSFG